MFHKDYVILYEQLNAQWRGVYDPVHGRIVLEYWVFIGDRWYLKKDHPSVPLRLADIKDLHEFAESIRKEFAK